MPRKIILAFACLTAWSLFGQQAVLDCPSCQVVAQTNPCGTAAHCTVLSWTASTTTGATYNIYRGTTTGGESLIALNATPVTGTTYTDPIALTASAQTYFYYVEAVETSGGVTALSIPSNEVSATFPAQPQAPTGAFATAH